MSRNRHFRSAVALLSAAALAAGTSATLFAAELGSASSHREAPLISGDPRLDNTDTYAFVSPDNPRSTTLIANWIPFEEPAGGPEFYRFEDGAAYNIKIDNDGDAKADITYRWVFRTIDRRKTDTFLYNNGPVTRLYDKNLLVRQTYRLTRTGPAGRTKTIVKAAPVAPSNVGKASMPNYAKLRNQAVRNPGRGTQIFAGQADDPFFLDLRVFDLLYGGDLSEVGSDTLSGYNVNSVALKVPTKSLTSRGDPVVGVWSTTERRRLEVQRKDGSRAYRGKFQQVSRLGMPLVNEVVVPAGLKDAFNALPPVKDATVPAIVRRVNNPEVPKLIESIYGIPAPKTPRDDLFSIFLTGIKGLNKPQGKVRPAEMIRLNTSIPPTAKPNRLGVLAGDNAGFPNGRRLTDDVVDIELQALEGAVRTGEIVAPLAAGDKVDKNDMPFRSSFPYLALPNSGSGTGAASTSSTRSSGTLDEEDSIGALPISAGLLGVLFAGAGVGLHRRGRAGAED